MSFLDAMAASLAYTGPAVAWWIVLFVVERVCPAMPLARTRAWWWRLGGLQLAMMAVGWLGAETWQLAFRGAVPWRAPLGPAPLAGALAYLASTPVFYAWHRLRHESDLCWRLFHQLHHSPARIEAATAFYNHPLEVLVSSALLSAVVHLGLGLDAAAYNWCALYGSCVGLFYHSNLRVPHAWSYVVQTPDLHRVHHQLGRHRGNYSDLPVLDVLFGTFVHPRTFDGRTGFEGEGELRLGALLAFRDVSRPAAPAAGVTSPARPPSARG